MSREKKRRIIIWLIFAIYIAVLLRITVFRKGFLQYALFSHGSIHIPFKCLAETLGRGEYFNFIYFIVGNLLCFVPFGFLLPLLVDRLRKLPVMLLLGFLLSFCIELSQFAFGTGESEVDDLILNTAGAAVGCWLYCEYEKHKDKKYARERN